MVVRGNGDPAELGDGGKPVAADDKLVADRALGKGARKRNDRGHADAALEEAGLGAAVGAGIAAGPEGALLGGVTVVGLEDDEGLFAEAGFVEVIEHGADEGVQGGDEDGVFIARAFEVLALIVLAPLLGPRMSEGASTILTKIERPLKVAKWRTVRILI